MLEKIKGLIKRHIVLFILCVIALIAIIVMLIFFLKMSINTSSKYGDRLDGIEKVELSKKDLSEIKDKILETEEVSSAKVRVQGKIVYIEFQAKSDVSTDAVKSISDEVLEKFSEDELKFYDFSFIVKWISETDDGEKTTAIEGYKHHNKTIISWTKG